MIQDITFGVYRVLAAELAAELAPQLAGGGSQYTEETH